MSETKQTNRLEGDTTDELLRMLRILRADRDQLNKQIGEIEAEIRKRVGDLAPSVDPPVQPIPRRRPPWMDGIYPNAEPYVAEKPPHWTPPIIWCGWNDKTEVRP